MVKVAFEEGTEVRVVRTIRNDGSYPGKDRGDILIKQGACGFVREFGWFLQDQLIYQVHFTDADMMVGCRASELILATDPWVDTKFVFGDWVQTQYHLAIKGAIIVSAGVTGQIFKVRYDLTPVQYEVLFDDRMLLVPENLLCSKTEQAVVLG